MNYYSLFTGISFKLAKAISIALGNFGIIWLLARYMTPDQLGKYQFLLSVIAVLSLSAYPGIKTALTQSISNGYVKSLKIGTFFSLRRAIAGSVILVAIAAYYFFGNDLEYSSIFLISALFFPFFYTLDNFTLFFTATRRFRDEAISYSLIYGTLLLTFYIALRFFQPYLAGIVGLYFLTQILFYIYYLNKTLKIANTGKEDPELINYGVFLTKISIFETIAKYIDRIIVGFFVSPAALATYSIGIMFVEKSGVIFKPMLTVLFPEFASKRLQLTNKIILLSTLGSVFLAAMYFLAIDIALKLFFPDYYESSLLIAQLYGISLIFLPTSIMFEYYFKAMKKRNIIVRFTGLSKAIYLVAITPTVFFFNVYGLVILKTVVSMIEFCLYTIYLNGFKFTHLVLPLKNHKEQLDV